MNALHSLVCILIGMGLATMALRLLADRAYRSLERDAAQALRLRRAQEASSTPVPDATAQGAMRGDR